MTEFAKGFEDFLQCPLQVGNCLLVTCCVSALCVMVSVILSQDLCVGLCRLHWLHVVWPVKDSLKKKTVSTKHRFLDVCMG